MHSERCIRAHYYHVSWFYRIFSSTRGWTMPIVLLLRKPLQRSTRQRHSSMKGMRQLLFCCAIVIESVADEIVRLLVFVVDTSKRENENAAKMATVQRRLASKASKLDVSTAHTTTTTTIACIACNWLTPIWHCIGAEYGIDAAASQVDQRRRTHRVLSRKQQRKERTALLLPVHRHVHVQVGISSQIDDPRRIKRQRALTQYVVVVVAAARQQQSKACATDQVEGNSPNHSIRADLRDRMEWHVGL
jgi:hypothetical protein